MGNVIGQIFRVTTFGESHGVALGCVIDGCPPKIPLTEKEIQIELDLRRPGQSKITTSRDEKDQVQILSGVFEGKTLGTPIAMVVFNKDCKSKDYEKLKDVFRPGHADFTWEKKYGFRDYRGGGRASGRETVSRVMAGAVAKKVLSHLSKIQIFAYTLQIGNIKGEKVDLNFIEKNPVRAADPSKAKKMEELILKTAQQEDSVGGIVEIIVKGVPLGLGEPVFDKLNADLAKALISIPSVKGIEFGSGFSAALKKGSQQNDPFTIKNGKIMLTKNNAGGILGGISTGQDLIIRIAVKPTSSVAKSQKTVNKQKKQINLQIEGRHDPCIVPRLIPVAKSMTAIVLVDHFLRYRAIKK